MTDLRSRHFAEQVILLFFGALAAATCAKRVSLFLDLSFSIYAHTTVLTAFVCACGVMVISRSADRHSTADPPDRQALLIVAMGGLIGTLLAVTIHLPNADDAVYVPKALYYVENPHSAIDNLVPYLADGTRVLTIPVAAASYNPGSYELLQAALAHLTGSHFLMYYHIIFPAIVGFVTVSSLFLCISLFSDTSRTAALATVVLVMLTLLLGETIRTYGNLSFARSFHAKFVFLVIGLHAAIYFSICFFRHKDMFSWCSLWLVTIGAAGMTTTAVIMLPALFAVLSVSAHVCQIATRSVRHMTLTQTLCYGLPLLPAVVFGIAFWQHANSQLAYGSAINSGFPQQFMGQVNLLLNRSYPVTGIMLTVAFAIVLKCSRHRLVFATWSLTVIVLFLNPLVSPYVMKYVTSENIYWRLFYLLPFPLVVGVAIAEVISRISSMVRVYTLTAATLALALCLACLSPTSVIRQDNAWIGWPDYKLDRQHVLVTREILKSVPHGDMLAPVDFANTVVAFTSLYPQVAVREDLLLLVFGAVGVLEEVNTRIAASSYLSGDGGDVHAFEELMAADSRPRSVILPPDGVTHTSIREVLTRNGYTRSVGLPGGWSAVFRPGS